MSEEKLRLMETVFKLNNQKFSIKTFGCKLNTYDTGFLEKKIEQRFKQNRETASESKPHLFSSRSIYILNTCAVTQNATQEAVKWVKSLRKKEASSLIVVTGCAAQVNTECFADLKAEGADLIVANSHKSSLAQLLEEHLKNETSKNSKNSETPEQKIFKSNIFKKRDLEFGGGEELSHTRSFLKIQDGCNSFCSFCIIPFARGRSRSVPKSELIHKVNELYDKGVREVVLTGVHIGDYKDLSQSRKGNLEDLLEALLKETKMPRFRLSSLEPIELSSFLLDLYKDERLCSHFHMSIQSAEDRVLKKMKRKYSFKEVEKSLNEISKRIPSPFVGMDVIVGFPGETEEEFEETYQRLSSLPWTRIHVFPYSLRKGTLASRMASHLPKAEVKRRAKKLRALSENRFRESSLKQIHTFKKVLFLKNQGNQLEDDFIHGLSRDYWRVKTKRALTQGRSMEGQEFKVLIQKRQWNSKVGSQIELIGSL